MEAKTERRKSTEKKKRNTVESISGRQPNGSCSSPPFSFIGLVVSLSTSKILPQLWLACLTSVVSFPGVAVCSSVLRGLEGPEGTERTLLGCSGEDYTTRTTTPGTTTPEQLRVECGRDKGQRHLQLATSGTARGWWALATHHGLAVLQAGRQPCSRDDERPTTNVVDVDDTGQKTGDERQAQQGTRPQTAVPAWLVESAPSDRRRLPSPIFLMTSHPCLTTPARPALHACSLAGLQACRLARLD